MNKRVQKVVEKLQTGNKTIVSFRRDQLKKAIQENAFDSMKTYDYDEVENAGRKTILNPTINDLEPYWLDNGDIWATIENNTLEVVVKYGYSTRRFYVNLSDNKETEAIKPAAKQPFKKNTVASIPVVEEQPQQATFETVKAEFKAMYNGMFSPEERRFILNTFKRVNKVSYKNMLDFYNKYFDLYKTFVNHAMAVYNQHGTLSTNLLTQPLQVVEIVPQAPEQPQEQQTNIINFADYKNKKQSTKEIKQPVKNSKITLCVCGSILKGDEIKLGICKNCVNYVYDMYTSGKLKVDNPELHKMIAEGLGD